VRAAQQARHLGWLLVPDGLNVVGNAEPVLLPLQPPPHGTVADYDEPDAGGIRYPGQNVRRGFHQDRRVLGRHEPHDALPWAVVENRPCACTTSTRLWLSHWCSRRNRPGPGSATSPRVDRGKPSRWRETPSSTSSPGDDVTARTS
jgi:hypothetical protein